MPELDNVAAPRVIWRNHPNEIPLGGEFHLFAPNVVVQVMNEFRRKWDFTSDWAKVEPEWKVTPVYSSQEDLRFGPRAYDAAETAIIRDAVASRASLSAHPLQLD